MTTFVEKGWGEDYVEDDELKKKLAEHFKKEAVMFDDLVTQVNNMSSASRSFKSDETSFNDHYEGCMKNLSAAKTAIDHSQFEAGQDLSDMRLQLKGTRQATDFAIEKSRADSELKIRQMRIDANKRMDLMEEEAREREK